jgi:hypothetical protein
MDPKERRTKASASQEHKPVSKANGKHAKAKSSPQKKPVGTAKTMIVTDKLTKRPLVANVNQAKDSPVEAPQVLVRKESKSVGTPDNGDLAKVE